MLRGIDLLVTALEYIRVHSIVMQCTVYTPGPHAPERPTFQCYVHPKMTGRQGYPLSKHGSTLHNHLGDWGNTFHAHSSARSTHDLLRSLCSPKSSPRSRNGCLEWLCSLYEGMKALKSIVNWTINSWLTDDAVQHKKRRTRAYIAYVVRVMCCYFYCTYCGVCTAM